MNIKDFFTGITHFFVILLPGLIVALALLYIISPELYQSLDLNKSTGITFIVVSYVFGHIISYYGSHFEDKAEFLKDETSPVLRSMVRYIINKKIGDGVAFQGNIRRWAASILREEDSNALGEIIRKDADRRFFRNIRVVVILLVVISAIEIIVHFGTEIIYQQTTISEFFINNMYIFLLMLISVIIIPLVNSRNKNQNKKYTQLVFESLICKFRDDLPSDYISTEARWFGKDEIPTELASIFSKTQKEVRTDSYWIGTLKKSSVSEFDRELFIKTGIKYRDSALELKTKFNNLASSNSFLNTHAKIEKWGKKNMGFFPEFVDFKNDNKWLSIEKTMNLLKYKYENDTLSQVDKNIFLSGPGCKIELTQIESSVGQYWTLAFEAFGEPKEQLNVLEKTTDYVFNKVNEDITHKLLNKKDSLSYPEWLNKSIKNENHKE